MTHFLRASLFLAALNFLAGNIPGIMPQLSRLTGFLVLLVWAGSYRPLKADKSCLSIFSVCAILVSLPLLLFESSVLLGISLCAFGLSVLSRSEQTEKDLPLFLITTVFYTVFVVLYRFSPHLWYLLQNISLGFSAQAGAMVGNKMTLGPSAMGMPITISVLCYCISLFSLVHTNEENGKKKRKKEKKRETERKGKALPIFLTVLGIIAMNAAYLWLQEPLTKAVHFFNSKWNPTPLDFQAVLLMLLLVPLYPVTRKITVRELPPEFPLVHLKGAVAAIFLVLIAALTLTFHPEGRDPHGDIVFFDRGANWAVPVYGKTYGQHSAGMFGMLPNYLKLRGYQTRIIKNTVTKKSLRGAGVIAVFNPVQNFSGPEKQLIYQFIEDGGSLLIAGDHTDVTGVMGPINDLLTPFNISLNFDTALPTASGWVDSLEKRPHPITKGIEKDYETSIWVGASLNISPPARPVIIGKRGWADMGNYLNTKRAFLGNYKRSSDEQLGDVVLTAESVYGKGKILVFGDTSTFQNGVLTSGYAFLDATFKWLSSRDNHYYPGRQFILTLILLGTAGYLLRRMPGTVLLVFCLVSLHIPLWTSQQVSDVLKTPEASAEVSSEYQVVHIDISHNERFSLFASAEESVWGICLNLMRNRYIPLFMKNFSEQALSESRLLIVIAPTAEFSQKEIAALRRFMEKGGNVIWSVGWEEAEASRSFLEAFGFSVDSVPLGPAEVQISRITANFLEAWPVTGGNESKQIIAEKFGYPIIVYQSVGKGGLMLIGDSEFLHSKNIESYKSYDLNNIRFFKYILDQLGIS